ncbi:MAG: hypothetical protein K0U78_06030 [Actinomycetia bacterium]|nr:hypothetical protein [Actinomycetes bacterium]
MEDSQTLELTARNVQALADKLDDPASARTLGSPCGQVAVTAVEAAGGAEAVAAPGTVPLTRAMLAELGTPGATVNVAGVQVVSVEDAAHYADRAPGVVYMPSTGEVR